MGVCCGAVAVAATLTNAGASCIYSQLPCCLHSHQERHKHRISVADSFLGKTQLMHANNMLMDWACLTLLTEFHQAMFCNMRALQYATQQVAEESVTERHIGCGMGNRSCSMPQQNSTCKGKRGRAPHRAQLYCSSRSCSISMPLQLLGTVPVNMFPPTQPPSQFTHACLHPDRATCLCV